MIGGQVMRGPFGALEPLEGSMRVESRRSFAEGSSVLWYKEFPKPIIGSRMTHDWYALVSIPTPFKQYKSGRLSIACASLGAESVFGC